MKAFIPNNIEKSLSKDWFTGCVIRHNSADSVPTSNLVCIKMASILNSQSRDLKPGSTFSNHCKVIFLSMKSLTRLRYQVKSLVHKMFKNEIDFHRMFDGILKSCAFFSEVLHGESADIPAKNIRCSCISSHVKQSKDWLPDHPRCAECKLYVGWSFLLTNLSTRHIACEERDGNQSGEVRDRKFLKDKFEKTD